ncbi:hypothetical protein TNCV_1183541 [Trichonephila clavipes]|nr:hypothetical protein TNCV_1183541 [Trichonephila clavipes]
MELLYNDSDIPTYLHYNGNGTNPDLTLASADIADDVEREVICDPGSGHRMIITGIGFDTKKSSTARFIAEQSKNPEDAPNWRKSVALPSKGNSYRETSWRRMIISRHDWYLETNNLLTSSQAGFRKCQSTNQQVVFLGQSIKDALDQRHFALALFVDFEAAF